MGRSEVLGNLILTYILLTTQAARGWTVRFHECVMRASTSTISHIFPMITFRIIWTVILYDVTETKWSSQAKI